MVESDRLEKDYAHYFDSRIVNNDFGETFNTLVRNQGFLSLKNYLETRDRTFIPTPGRSKVDLID